MLVSDLLILSIDGSIIPIPLDLPVLIDGHIGSNCDGLRICSIFRPSVKIGLGCRSAELKGMQTFSRDFAGFLTRVFILLVNPDLAGGSGLSSARLTVWARPSACAPASAQRRGS